MKIEVKLPFVDANLNKDNCIEKMDTFVKCYLKHSSWLRISRNTLYKNDVSEIIKKTEITDEEFEKIKMAMPYSYLYMDPGSDEEWIGDWGIFDIISHFELVVIKVYTLKKPAVDKFLQEISNCHSIFKLPFERISNKFDYEYIVLATNYQPKI